MERSAPYFKPLGKYRKPETLSTDISGGYSIKGRIWLAKDDETFLGYGRVVLLQRIKEHGSITRAAKSMGMSYRHAWELVESMNRQAGKILVDTATGGKGGGGSILTETGENAVKLFNEMNSSFKVYLEQKQEQLKNELLG